MEFQFNVRLDRANCHIRAVRTTPLPNEILNDRPHKHYSIEFHCILSGRAIVTLPHENREIPLTAGNILLLPQGIYHGVYTKDTPVERICFNFSAEPAGKEGSPIVDLFVNINKPVLFHSEEATTLVEQYRRLCRQTQGPMLELRHGMHFLNMALNLMSSIQDVPTKPASEDPLALRQKWTIEDYINRHFTDNSGIEGLANTLYLSQRQTSTLVKRFFGEEYKAMVIRRRMELAEIYLQDPDKLLEQIAYEVGYRSYSGFELCFKRFWGLTPQKMRNKLINERKEIL